MSRLHGRLTALAVKHATKCGLHPDGAGLHLQISRNGSRSWIFRYRMGGRRRYCGLGNVEDVSLAQARERAAAARLMLQNNQDPIEAKRGRRAAAMLTVARAMSFSKAATTYIESHAVSWKPKHAEQWRTSIDTYANPVLGALPVGEIDTGLVLKVLQPIWTTKTETASRLRGRIEAVLDWAKVAGYRTGENPARWAGHLDTLLPAKAKVAPIVHHKALPYAEVGTFMAQLREFTTVDARALEFTILTAARSDEALGARWDEIDLQVRLWTVPAERMKSRREHRVPLSDAVVKLLGALPGPHDGPVFPGRKAGHSINRTRLLGALRQINADVTVHGFRSSFRDWAGDRTAFARDVVEAALAHAIGDATEAAYRRGDALEKRRKLMEAWASFCAGKLQPGAEVIELRSA
jgi:integrase